MEEELFSGKLRKMSLDDPKPVASSAPSDSLIPPSSGTGGVFGFSSHLHPISSVSSLLPPGQQHASPAPNPMGRMSLFPQSTGPSNSLLFAEGFGSSSFMTDCFGDGDSLDGLSPVSDVSSFPSPSVTTIPQIGSTSSLPPPNSSSSSTFSLRRVQTSPSALSSDFARDSSSTTNPGAFFRSPNLGPSSSGIVPSFQLLRPSVSSVSSVATSVDDETSPHFSNFGSYSASLPGALASSSISRSYPSAYAETESAISHDSQSVASVDSTPRDPTILNLISSSSETNPPPMGMRRTQSSPMPLQSLEKVQKRLARKAEAARTSRRKKKAYIQALEEKLTRLNARLAEIEAGPSEIRGFMHEMFKKEQNSLKDRLYELLENREENQELVKELVTSLIQNSRKRNHAAEYFLGKCQEGLAPNLQVKFALWSLSQGDDFYDKPGLWRSVMGDELGLSEEQLQQLKSFREPVGRMRQALENLQSRMKRLRETVYTHLHSRDQHLDELVRHVEPWQVAKFCTWVDRNPLCMQMLNTVWKT